MVNISPEERERREKAEEMKHFELIAKALVERNYKGARGLTEGKVLELREKYDHISYQRQEELDYVKVLEEDGNDREVMFRKAMVKGYNSQLRRLEAIIIPLEATVEFINRGLAA
jgi:hypothetical protein